MDHNSLCELFFSVYSIVLLSIIDIYPSWLVSFPAFSQVTNTVRWDLGMRLVDLHVAVALMSPLPCQSLLDFCSSMALELFHKIRAPNFQYYISITIVPSYTGKYHEFVAVCIVTSAQHE